MFKRFLSYYKGHVPLFTFDMLCAVGIAVCNLFYPTITKNIINDYINDQTPKRIIFWAAILLLIYILKSALTYVVAYYGHVVGIRIQGDMRRDLFEKYEKLPFSYYDENKTGDMISRLTNDLFDVSELVHHGPENLFLAVLMLIGSFVILGGINMTLTLIMFAVTPFIVLFTFLSRKSMSRQMKASRQKMSEINSNVENSIGGIRETKAYVAEHYEICAFNKTNSDFMFHRRMAMKALGTYESIMAFLADLLYLVIIFVGGLFLFYGKIDGGEFAAFILYITLFITPINKFVILFQQTEEGMSGFSRFHEIMNEEEEIDTGTVILDDVVGSISFRDVSFSYKSSEGETPVINSLCLDVLPGETLALVGSSGGGKTTICHLIPRFYNIDSGSIKIDGVDVRDIKLKSLREKIGIVSQSVFLFDGTIGENIAYGCPDASEEQIVEAAKKANIHEYVTTLPNGYSTEVGERGVKLSGGQRQRVAIARLFLKNPAILILDEATSALDNATEMQIQSALAKLSEGRTVIVVAHRLSTVKGADKIAVIGDNGILEYGTHDSLLEKRGEYYKLYSYQFENSGDENDKPKN